MIRNLRIKNYALLKDVSIDFREGFTVISGETGAGKSIMIDAIGMLFGRRAEKLNAGKNNLKTVIEGTFSIKKSKILFFKERDIDFQELTLVRREINLAGKSRSFINDSPVLLSTLLDFGNEMLEIHTQNQSSFLKSSTTQFSLIDELSGSKDQLTSYQLEFRLYNKLKKELSLFSNSGEIAGSELELLEYQFEELESSDLRLGEKEEIEKKIIMLESAEEISAVISDSEVYFNSEQGIISQLSNIRRRLLSFDIFNKLKERVESVIIELNDLSSDLSLIDDNLESDSEELSILNRRLNIINNLLQKHRKSSVEELLHYKKEIQDKISLATSFDLELKVKKERIEQQFLVLNQAASALNEKRSSILSKFAKDVENCLIRLGMPFAQFVVKISAADSFDELGNTNIVFLFSANRGVPMLEMSKVASGGELSRLMLSIKYISAESSDLDTMILDEIDAGVSGHIASLMANMMQEISKSTQLIVISHLPQIAANCNEHFKIVKTFSGDNTFSDVIMLNNKERVEEIAKLLSGEEVTKEAFENARVLLGQ